MSAPAWRTALRRGSVRVGLAGVIGVALLTLSAPTAVSAWVGTAPLPESEVAVTQPPSALVRLAGTNLCLEAGASAPGLRECDGSTAQTWSFLDDGSVRAVTSAGTVCLTVPASSVEPGARVAVTACADTTPVAGDDERWSVVTTDDGARLVSALDETARVAPMRCLRAPGADALTLAACLDAVRSTWLVLPVVAPVAVPSATP